MCDAARPQYVNRSEVARGSQVCMEQELSDNEPGVPSDEVELLRRRVADLEARNSVLELLAATDEGLFLLKAKER